jgi:hypothetical protein
MYVNSNWAGASISLMPLSLHNSLALGSLPHLLCCAWPIIFTLPLLIYFFPASSYSGRMELMAVHKALRCCDASARTGYLVLTV